MKDAKKLPLNLLDALRALEASPVLRKGLGEPFISAYLKSHSAMRPKSGDEGASILFQVARGHQFRNFGLVECAVAFPQTAPVRLVGGSGIADGKRACFLRRNHR